MHHACTMHGMRQHACAWCSCAHRSPTVPHPIRSKPASCSWLSTSVGCVASPTLNQTDPVADAVAAPSATQKTTATDLGKRTDPCSPCKDDYSRPAVMVQATQRVRTERHKAREAAAAIAAATAPPPPSEQQDGQPYGKGMCRGMERGRGWSWRRAAGGLGGVRYHVHARCGMSAGAGGQGLVGSGHKRHLWKALDASYSLEFTLMQRA